MRNCLRAFFLGFLTLLAFPFLSLSVEPQSVDEVIASVRSSMNDKNTNSFSDLLDNSVEITYGTTHSTYSKSHAIIILNDFYHKQHPKSFRVDYKGFAPQRDGQYIIGTAITENGPFRIYLYIKNRGGRYLIQEMKIAK